MTLPSRDLLDGTTIPAIGLGTYPLRGDDGVHAMASAIEAGYRLLDSAVNYRNEREVGEAVRAAGVDRDELVIQTKVAGRDHTAAVRSIETSLQVLGLDRLDVVLIHWPNPSRDEYVTAWEGLVEARERGLVRTIGVSNFAPHHLDRVTEATGVTPALNQVELHPYFPQEEQVADDARRGTVTQAWSPLGKAEAPYREEAVVAVAEAHGVTPPQVVLRWHVQRGVVPLPKSGDPGRQRANLDVEGFALDDTQMAAITGLGRPDGRLFDGDPDTHEEM